MTHISSHNPGTLTPISFTKFYPIFCSFPTSLLFSNWLIFFISFVILIQLTFIDSSNFLSNGKLRKFLKIGKKVKFRQIRVGSDVSRCSLFFSQNTFSWLLSPVTHCITWRPFVFNFLLAVYFIHRSWNVICLHFFKTSGYWKLRFLWIFIGIFFWFLRIKL